MFFKFLEIFHSFCKFKKKKKTCATLQTSEKMWGEKERRKREEENFLKYAKFESTLKNIIMQSKKRIIRT